MAYKQQKSIPLSSGDWGDQDGGVSRSGVWWESASWSTDCSLYLQVPPPWGLGFSIWIWGGGHKYSVYDRYTWKWFYKSQDSGYLWEEGERDKDGHTKGTSGETKVLFLSLMVVTRLFALEQFAKLYVCFVWSSISMFYFTVKILFLKSIIRTIKRNSGKGTYVTAKD